VEDGLTWIMVGGGNVDSKGLVSWVCEGELGVWDLSRDGGGVRMILAFVVAALDLVGELVGVVVRGLTEARGKGSLESLAFKIFFFLELEASSSPCLFRFRGISLSSLSSSSSFSINFFIAYTFCSAFAFTSSRVFRFLAVALFLWIAKMRLRLTVLHIPSLMHAICGDCSSSGHAFRKSLSIKCGKGLGPRRFCNQASMCSQIISSTSTGIFSMIQYTSIILSKEIVILCPVGMSFFFMNIS